MRKFLAAILFLPAIGFGAVTPLQIDSKTSRFIGAPFTIDFYGMTLLNLPIGGGNVSNSGTPLVDQVAVWTDATHIKGIPTLRGGSDTQVLTKQSIADYDWLWATIGIGNLANLSTTSRLIGSSATSSAIGEISLGTNLSMSGSTLNASGGGGGNVSTSGTITTGQLAEWVTGTTIRSDTAAQAKTAIGATTVGGNLVSLTNPSAITFLKVNADNSVTTDSAATFRTDIGATTVGSNLFTLTNPSAITFPKFNADNSVTAESAATHRTSIGGTTVGQNFFTLTNPSAVTFPKIDATNAVITESASTHRTSIGATTVGSNLFTLTNPSAITFLKVNADNSITAENASTFRGDISAAGSGAVGSSGLTMNTARLLGRTTAAAGSIEEISATSPITVGSGSLSLNVGVDFGFTFPQNITATDVATNIVTRPIQLNHTLSSGSPAAGMGTGILFDIKDSSQLTPAAFLDVAWSNATHATKTAYMDFSLANAGSDPVSKMRLFGSGGLSVNSTTDPGAGIINANTGFKIGNVSLPFAGGTTSQILTKASNTDYDWTWTTPSGGGNVSNNGTPTIDQTAVWTDATHIKGVTTLKGGTTSQILSKASNTDYDWTWTTASGGGNVSNNGTPLNTQFAAWTDATHIQGVPSLIYDGTIPATATLSPAANTFADGLLLKNPTTASAGNQQYAPPLRFMGHGFLTGTGDQQVDWRIGAYSFDANNNGIGISSFLFFQRGLNGVFNTHYLTIDENANISGQNGGDASATFATFNAIDKVVIGAGYNGNSDGFFGAGSSNGVLMLAGAPTDGTLPKIVWSSGNQYFTGSLDLSIGRDSAGVLGVYSGIGSTLGTVKALNVLPVGGTTSQVLKKNSNTDYDVGWTTISGGGNVSNVGTPTANQIAQWTDATHVQGVTPTSPIVAGSGSLSLNVGVDHAFTASQTITLTDALTTQATRLISLAHNVSTTAGNGLGAGITFQAQDANGIVSQTQGSVVTAWSDVTSATRTAYLDFLLVNNAAAEASKMRLFGSGGLSVNSTTDPGAGIINANSGFAKGGTEFPIASNGVPKRTGANTYSALSSTTVGENLLTLTNPSAITFLRINADNSVTAQTAANYKTDLGLNNVTNDAQIKASDFPASSVDAEIALFNSTTGKSIKRATGSGIVTATSGVYGTVTAPSGAVVGTTDTQTLTNKRITQRVVAQASGATWSPNGDTSDVFTITTAQATNVTTINAPSGTPTDGQKLIFRIKCDTTPRTLAGWNAAYRFSSDMTAPSTLVASHTLYMAFIYNSTDSVWDNVAQMNNF